MGAGAFATLTVKRFPASDCVGYQPHMLFISSFAPTITYSPPLCHQPPTRTTGDQAPSPPPTAAICCQCENEVFDSASGSPGTKPQLSAPCVGSDDVAPVALLQEPSARRWTHAPPAPPVRQAKRRTKPHVTDGALPSAVHAASLTTPRSVRLHRHTICPCASALRDHPLLQCPQMNQRFLCSKKGSSSRNANRWQSKSLGPTADGASTSTNA